MEIVNKIKCAGVETLFPRFCLRCNKEGVAWCQACDESYALRQPAPSCPFCHSGDSDRTCAACKPLVFTDGLSALTYYADPIVRNALTSWKYYGDEAYGSLIERWLRRGVDKINFPALPLVITHVPLHARKRRARGFDQAERIARILSEETGLEALPLLHRRIFTEPQANRPHADRLVGDLDGIFRVFGPVPEHLILCDDVFTSGMTMDAAAMALKEAGAKTVWGFAIGRGASS